MASPAPEWARSLAPVDYERFRDIVVATLAEIAPGVPVDEAAGRVALVGDNVADLRELAAAIAAIDDREAWPRIIREHLRSLVLGPETAAALLDDPVAARTRLRLQLHREADLVDAPQLVQRNVLPDVTAVVLLELDDVLASLPPEEAVRIGDTDTIFAAAADGTRAAGAPNIEEVEVAPEVVLTALSDGTVFCATHALWPDRFVAIGDHGVFVAVPTQDLVLLHPLSDAAASSALGSMVVQARHHNEIGPGSLSPHVYWCRNHIWEVVDAELVGGSFQVEPSDDLLAALDDLGA